MRSNDGVSDGMEWVFNMPRDRTANLAGHGRRTAGGDKQSKDGYRAHPRKRSPVA